MTRPVTREEGPPLATSSASPPPWAWSLLDGGRPRRALEHITHSEASLVALGQLSSADDPPQSSWTLAAGIPILVSDTQDAYWAFERVMNKLHGTGPTASDARRDLAAKLGSHLTLLSAVESPKMAPILKLELQFLRAVMRPAPGKSA